ncbi:MAG: PP2C family protein-serine/threonine phosphatase [Sandaracinaceae bacterium]
MRFLHSQATHIGRRDNNEDQLLLRPTQGLYAVADGMGGYEGGEVASRLALETLDGYVERANGAMVLDAVDGGLMRGQLELAIRMADRAVRRAAQGGLSRMGTTLAMLVVQDDRALVAHVGDSRVYRLRDRELEPLTRDHSLSAELEAAGFQGPTVGRSSTPFGHVVTQALGQGRSIQPDFRLVSVRPGDAFLVCSDGLTDVLADDDLEAMLGEDEVTAGSLVRLAFELGGHDNITAILLRVVS